MFRHIFLISARKRWILRHLLLTIKRPNLPSSEEQSKPLHFLSSSTRLFKLWMKPQMVVKKHSSSQPTSISSLFSFFKFCSPEFNDQTDSDFIINTLIFQLLNRNLSLETSHEYTNADADNFMEEVINVFTETEFDKSYENEISSKNNVFTPRWYFSGMQSQQLRSRTSKVRGPEIQKSRKAEIQKSNWHVMSQWAREPVSQCQLPKEPASKSQWTN